jgi:hypothetical protein
LTLGAVICFVLAFVGVGIGGFSLVALGLALWAAGTLIG